MISRACRCNRIPSGFASLVCVLSAALLPVEAIGQGDRPAAPAAFNTRLGAFTPQTWSALAGWSGEAHAEALGVFRQTCRSLQRRETWRATCAAAQSVGTDAGAAREFFEGQFVPYMVKPIEGGREGLLKEGLMTGYFEPVLEGSAVRKAPFVVPVHGVPPDLLQLDARRWQGIANDGKLRATLAGDQVVPLGARSPQDPAPELSLEVDPAVFDSEPLDRRFRVRRDGNRIVPYWTRQQIEAGAVPSAPVIAWVDDAQALYLMQVQGSGQIRLPGGRTIRLSYADQNGHPFRPRGIQPTAIRTRSLPGAVDAEPVAVATPVSMRTLSLIAAGPPAGPVRKKGSRKAAAPEVANLEGNATTNGEQAAPAEKAADRVSPERSPAPDIAGDPGKGRAAAGAEDPGRRPAADDASFRPVHDVERIVDALLAQPSRQKSTNSRAAVAPLPAPASGSPSGRLPGADARDARATANLSYLVAAREKDPSYVFFQPAAPGGSGPMGALGVPLTATRSIAVDPRSTPLGSPVFIEAERDDADGPLRRLMIAQDTGGAIRGAVRADFFWGTGPKAGAQAVRTRDDLTMWVLLPRSFARPKGSASRTRGVGAAATVECVMPDSDYCLE